MSTRTIICGDPHGCLDEFDELLKLISYTKDDDLIIVGDLLDRGPNSVGVVERCRELNARCVRGNHEDKYLRHRRNLKLRGHSQVQMSKSKLDIFFALSEEDWTYLESLPLFIKLTDTLVVVHAGLQRNVALEAQEDRTLVSMRYADRETGKMVGMILRDDEYLRPSTTAFWTELWTGPESVIYGHHPTLDGLVAIDRLANDVVCYGIDTGCCFGRKLSALVYSDFDREPEIAAVDAKSSYAKAFSERIF